MHPNTGAKYSAVLTRTSTRPPPISPATEKVSPLARGRRRVSPNAGRRAHPCGLRGARRPHAARPPLHGAPRAERAPGGPRGGRRGGRRGRRRGGPRGASRGAPRRGVPVVGAPEGSKRGCLCSRAAAEQSQ